MLLSQQPISDSDSPSESPSPRLFSGQTTPSTPSTPFSTTDLGFDGDHLDRTISSEADYRLLERSIDDLRPIKVVVIGAGVSGIVAGIQLPKNVRNLDLTIYEAHDDIGGTWHANHYPGVACDLPSHTYQLTFEPNPSWSAFYAPGHEIKSYFKRVAEKYKVDQYIKLSHRVTSAQYLADSGKWSLTVLNVLTGVSFSDMADFVLSTTGPLSRWNWPDIPSIHDFQGQLMHSAQYDSEMGRPELENGADKDNWLNRKIAVIGVGSSAIQIVPSLQKVCGKVTNFVRGKTWIAIPFLSNYIAESQVGGANHKFTPEEIQRFKDDPEYYFQWRKKLEGDLNSVFGTTQKGHPQQKEALTVFRALMEKKLSDQPWIADHLIPDFPVTCRRLTPGPGYLEALQKENVEFVPTGIKRFTRTGIELVDGKHHEFDTIICATGFDTTFKPHFDIIGRDCLSMAEARNPHPKTYLSTASRGFPNWFEIMGPNSGVGAGSLLIIIERAVDYAVKVIKKLQKERYKSIEVKQEAVDDFDEYIESYFKRTVFSQNCRSWYKMGTNGNRVAGLWPGSNLHALHALDEPRWEDYDFEPIDKGVKNRFYYLGNGWTEPERDPEGDRASYLVRN